MSRRPRIKLITIPWEVEVPTLGLASLAAVTPPQVDLALVDLVRERLVLDEPVDLVGITASTPRIKAAYALADLYRSMGVKVVLGGHHVTAMPDEGLGHADAVVVGEGEGSWMRICDELLTQPSRVGGLYKEPVPDLARLPQPRVDLMKIERYGRFYYPLIATRGCVESCSFCFSKRMSPAYRTYPISHVLEQLRRMPPWVQSAYFVDDNLPGDLDYARELFRALRRKPAPFGMQARWEFGQRRDDLRLAREAGCIFMSSGYESINQTTLDKTGKQAQADGYREVIKNVFDEGIMASGNWMFGFDWDTPEVFDETIAFLDGCDLSHSTFTCEIPFPGTPAYRKYKREGRLLSDDYDDYVGKDHVLVRPKGMTPDELRAGIRRVALTYFSMGRATKRFLRAAENRKVFSEVQGPLRVAALAFLNYFQVWQWHYRMVPSIQWLYRRLVDWNKFRYATELYRTSNFEPRGEPEPFEAGERHEPQSAEARGPADHTPSAAGAHYWEGTVTVRRGRSGDALAVGSASPMSATSPSSVTAGAIEPSGEGAPASGAPES